jgi:hypothetical protein
MLCEVGDSELPKCGSLRSPHLLKRSGDGKPLLTEPQGKRPKGAEFAHLSYQRHSFGGNRFILPTASATSSAQMKIRL